VRHGISSTGTRQAITQAENYLSGQLPIRGRAFAPLRVPAYNPG
jgi:hypothetical protein